MSERVHKKACLTCGCDLTEGQARRQDEAEDGLAELLLESASTYAHMRAVIANCDTASDVRQIKHQLVGLLPETRQLDPEYVKKMRANGLDHLVERLEAGVREAWAKYGFGAA